MFVKSGKMAKFAKNTLTFKAHCIEIRALRGTGAGLNLVELCGTWKNSENFSILKTCAGWEWDQIMGLRGGSKVKIWSRAGL